MLLMYLMITVLTIHSMSLNYVPHSLMMLNSIIPVLVMPIFPTSLLLFSTLLSVVQIKTHHFMLYLLINIHYSCTYNNYFPNILFTLNLTAKTKMMSNCILQTIMVPQTYYLNILITTFNMLSNLTLLSLQKMPSNYTMIIIISLLVIVSIIHLQTMFPLLHTPTHSVMSSTITIQNSLLLLSYLFLLRKNYSLDQHIGMFFFLV